MHQWSTVSASSGQMHDQQQVMPGEPDMTDGQAAKMVYFVSGQQQQQQQPPPPQHAIIIVAR